MVENRKSLTLYPNKRKIILLLIISLLFTSGGVWMITSGELAGWLVSLFFGIGCLVFIVILLPHSSYLRLSEKGFEVRSLFRSGFTSWNEVNKFVSGYIGPNKMVVFNYSPEYKKNKPSRELAKNLAGFEGALPDTYGKTAEELSEILNEWRKGHRGC